MAYPAVGFGQPLPASFALAPFDRGASPLGWARPALRAAARQAVRHAPTASGGSPAPAFDLEALIDAIRTALAGFLGEPAAGDGAGGDGMDGGGSTPDEPESQVSWPRPERDGRSFGAGGGGTGGGVGASGSGTASRGASTGVGGNQAAAGRGAVNGAASTAPSRSASGGGFFGAGPVDMTGGIGLGLGALSMAPGLGGVLGTIAGAGLRVNNMLAAQKMLEDAGLPGYDPGQWVGGALGWNSYGSGSPNKPIGYTPGGTAITPSGYQYGTDGVFGPVLDAFGLGDGWSYAIDPSNAGREPTKRSMRLGQTTANPRQMPDAMRRDLRASVSSPFGTGGGTGGSANAGTPNVSAHTLGGGGFTQQGRAGGGGVSGGPAAPGRTSAQQVV